MNVATESLAVSGLVTATNLVNNFNFMNASFIRKTYLKEI